MNALDLPFTSKETQDEVKNMDEVWLIVGPVRIAQHLSNVWHMSGYTRQDVLSKHADDHPLSRWAAQSFANYSWLYFYGTDMCEEYKRRFNLTPSIQKMLTVLEEAPNELPELDWTEPPHA